MTRKHRAILRGYSVCEPTTLDRSTFSTPETPSTGPSPAAKQDHLFIIHHHSRHNPPPLVNVSSHSPTNQRLADTCNARVSYLSYLRTRASQVKSVERIKNK